MPPETIENINLTTLPFGPNNGEYYNRGSNKVYKHIAGNLIAFAGIQAIKEFAEMACVSLVPKTELIEHYMTKYSMLQAGRSLFLDGKELQQLIAKYDHE